MVYPNSISGDSCAFGTFGRDDKKKNHRTETTDRGLIARKNNKKRSAHNAAVDSCRVRDEQKKKRMI